MKKYLKSALCFVLVLSLLSGLLVCFATSGDGDKDYVKYGKYVLLGDSVAAGFDEQEFVNTEFVRVDHSYAAVIADTLGIELVPLACQGFRTIEMRYMFEDDFVPDSYLFHDTYDIPRTEALKPFFRQSVAEADLITLGLGGNDVGTYLAWVVVDAVEQGGKYDAFVDAAKKMLEDAGIKSEPLNSLLDLAKTMGVLQGVLKVLPGAVQFGVTNYLKNWSKVMDDIYALNPDVTLVVVGLFDTQFKSEEDIANATGDSLSQKIVDLINTPMKANADKYGYIFVEPTEIVCFGAHPTKAGYKRIADFILAALPDAKFPYDDVHANDWYYDAVKYALSHGLMTGKTENEFKPKANMTRAEAVELLYKAAGSPDVSGLKEPYLDVKNNDAITWAYNNGIAGGFASGRIFAPVTPVNRAQFAAMLYRLAGSPAVSGSLKYYDKYSVPAYAKNAVIWATENGILNDVGGTMFRPAKTVTRAEAAFAVMNFLEK